MVLTRVTSQRAWLLTRQGKSHFTMPSNGSEATGVGAAYALRPGIDICLAYARDLGAVLTLGMTPREVMLGVLARADDPSSGGRSMPLHFHSMRLKIISHSSPAGTQIPQAAGVALASNRLQHDEVTLCFFGDGAASKGDFHEGLNMAGVFRLPVVFICVNNSLAISTPTKKQYAGDSIAMRAAAYGFPGVQVDGTDPVQVYTATAEAVARARRGEGPTLIEATTVRLMPHSTSDDDSRYRDEATLEAARLRDPLLTFKQTLLQDRVLDEATDTRIWAECQTEVDEAIAWAESRPLPEPESALGHVYAPEMDGTPTSLGGVSHA